MTKGDDELNDGDQSDDTPENQDGQAAGNLMIKDVGNLVENAGCHQEEQSGSNLKETAEQFITEFTFLSMNFESLKEKQNDHVGNIQSNSMSSESPVLWSIVITLHQVRAELEILGVDINTRNKGPWKGSQLQRLVNLYTSVNKVILNLENYVKDELNFKNVYKDISKESDAEVAPKSEPDTGHISKYPPLAQKRDNDATVNNFYCETSLEDKSGANVKDEMLEADGIKIEVDPVVVINQSTITIDEDTQALKEDASKDEIQPSGTTHSHEQEKELIKPEEDERSISADLCEDLNNDEMEEDFNDEEDYENDPSFDDPETKSEDLDIKREEGVKYKKSIIKSTKTVSKKFRCLICDEVLSGVKLKEHTLEHHGEGPYECSLCHEPLDSIKDLRDHRWKHYGKELIECKICNKKMARSSLNPHMKYHTGEGLQECEICFRKFTPSDLKFHMMGAHLGEKPFRYVS
jgi:hypothetical protein